MSLNAPYNPCTRIEKLLSRQDDRWCYHPCTRLDRLPCRTEITIFLLQALLLNQRQVKDVMEFVL